MSKWQKKYGKEHPEAFRSAMSIEAEEIADKILKGMPAISYDDLHEINFNMLTLLCTANKIDYQKMIGDWVLNKRNRLVKEARKK